MIAPTPQPHPSIPCKCWSLMASLRLSGLDAAKLMGLHAAQSMRLYAAKLRLDSLKKFKKQPLGPECEENCVIKPKMQVFHLSMTTKLYKHAGSPSLSMASLIWGNWFIFHSFSLVEQFVKTCIQALFGKSLVL